MKKASIYIIFSLIFFANRALAQEAIAMENDSASASSFYEAATVQALNKSTAKTSILELKMGQKVQFGTIAILAHKCWQASLDQRPESKMLLEIFETKSDGKNTVEKRIFYGWMFASSPSIAGLEHPIYDVIALSCKK